MHCRNWPLQCFCSRGVWAHAYKHYPVRVEPGCLCGGEIRITIALSRWLSRTSPVPIWLLKVRSWSTIHISRVPCKGSQLMFKPNPCWGAHLGCSLLSGDSLYDGGVLRRVAHPSVAVERVEGAQVGESHEDDGQSFVDHHRGGSVGQSAVAPWEVPHTAQEGARRAAHQHESLGRRESGREKESGREGEREWWTDHVVRLSFSLLCKQSNDKMLPLQIITGFLWFYIIGFYFFYSWKKYFWICLSFNFTCAN